MKRKILILLCLILFIVSIAGVSATQDLNQTVDDDANDLVSGEDTLTVSLNDGDVLGSKDDGTFTALQKKINNAPSGSTIYLENDYEYDEGFSESGIYISKDLTIEGDGHKIDGLDQSRIFDIHSEVILSDITFLNGNSGNANKKDGGAIYVDGGLSVYDSHFINNRAGKYYGGGAIYVCLDGNLAVSHSIFDSNTAQNGGAINVHGNLDLYDVSFNGNIAENGEGGAIYTSADSIIMESEFNENEGIGGAIYNCGDMLLYDSNFNSNYIYNLGSLFLNNNSMSQCAIQNYEYENDLYNNWKLYRGTINSDINIKILDNSTKSINLGDSVELTKEITDDNGNKIKVWDFKFYVNGSPVDDVYTPTSEGQFIVSTKDFKDGPDFYVETGTIIVSGVNLNVPDVTKNYGGPEKLEITLTERGSPVANAQVKINLNGVDYPKTTDSKGKASMAINLNAGNYPAKVTYQDVSTTAKVTVNQLTSKTTLSSSKNSHNSVTLTATVNPSTAAGNVVFNVNGKDYPASKISDSKATYTLNNLAVGSYEAKAVYDGDVNHKSSSSGSVKFTVEDVKYDVSASDLTKYYKGSERFVVTVKEDNKPVVGKDVTINLNGKPYTKTTDSNGQASMAINLNSGVYNVTSDYDGVKVQSKITVKSTVSGSDVTKIFRNGTQYYARFVDTKGNLMKNTAVNFNINGVFYKRTTDEYGVAKMNINLPPKTYIITAENPDSTEKYTNVIDVLPSIVENHDLTKYYKNASKYTLRILGDDGKPVGEGIAVKLNINGIFYTKYSDKNGYVGMNINLPPGTYIVTAEYNGLRASNTINVLSVLQTKDLSMKYKDGSKFEVKILDGQGKPYAGQTVTFNINGVFYQKATGEDGVARLNINLLAGEYVITTTYNGLNSANKIIIEASQDNSQGNDEPQTPNKLDTRFVFKDMSFTYMYGSVLSATILLDLVDENGNVLEKPITGIIKKSNNGVVSIAGNEKTGTSGSPLNLPKKAGTGSFFAYVEFKGDDRYNGCTYTSTLFNSS